MNQKLDQTERNESTSILRKGITKYPLTAFFILSFLLIILFVLIRAILFLFGYFEVIEFVLQLFTVTTPTFAAIIVSYALGGWSEVKKTFYGFTKWKVNWIWYFFGFLLILAPLLYAIIYNLITNFPLYFAQSYTIPAFIIQCILLLIRGPLSEEPGWRGFALPRLESRFTALTSSIILGLIWAFWHLPMYFVETRWPFYISLVIITVLSILFAWAYNNTKGSLVITVLFHFCFNFTGVFITEMTPLMIFYIGAGIMIGVWVIIVIIYEGPSKLSKKLDSEMPFSRRITN